MGTSRRTRDGDGPEDETEEMELLTKDEREERDRARDRDRDADDVASVPRTSIGSSASSDASFSLGLIDRVSGRPSFHLPSSSKWASRGRMRGKYRDEEGGLGGYKDGDEDEDEDEDARPVPGGKPPDRKARMVFWILLLVCAGAWGLAFVVFWFSSSGEGDYATSGAGNGVEVTGGDVDAEVVNPPGINQQGEKITMEQWLDGTWSPVTHELKWISGGNGEDGLYLETQDDSSSQYLRVADIRSRKDNGRRARDSTVLMKHRSFTVDGNLVFSSKTWPSPDLKTVLVISDVEKTWRHSYKGKYWLFDVESQKAQPLDPQNPDSRIQLASWSPTSDAVVFTRDNNMFIRNLSSKEVTNITTDGGPDVFNGVPDWVYEEEVFHGNSATWWSRDGKYIAFLRTDETKVPEFPVQYFLSRPSGNRPAEGEENYPDVVNIKYPKAGAPNPTVDIQFYDVEKGEVFAVDNPDESPDEESLIVEVVWGNQGEVLVRETDRESDVLRMVHIDAGSQIAETVRSEDVAEVDGGWVEVPLTTRFIPADEDNGRPNDGYIDTVVKDGYKHLAYFPSLDSSDPVFLTSGDWEVVDSPTAVDLDRGLVYFAATKEATWDRHVYSVKLDGSDMKAVTDTSNPGYYDISFSSGAGYGLISYQGPGIPWQKIISTPANDQDPYDEVLEENKTLKRIARKHAMPSLIYSTITIDNFTLPVLEQRPPTFDPEKKYPVLFHLYGGPGSQTVDKKFSVNFQTYVASSLEYIVVTVDGRGTGFNGRKAQCIIRDNIGYYEARDQIETAKAWGNKPYVDESRMAIWGWSYGGFMTLKALEQDAGRTFQYGMAVAPVTDWRFYDSIYTERFMHTPQNNPEGYEKSAISNMTALGETTRFLVVHGASDDNVHIQNSLSLLDDLDLAGVNNYDVHVFPDSAHSITFHNAYPVLHTRLSDWLVNAFNGEWDKIRNPVPNPSLSRRALNAARRFWAH